jgi:hypothetical protein
MQGTKSIEASCNCVALSTEQIDSCHTPLSIAAGQLARSWFCALTTFAQKPTYANSACINARGD